MPPSPPPPPPTKGMGKLFELNLNISKLSELSRKFRFASIVNLSLSFNFKFKDNQPEAICGSECDVCTLFGLAFIFF